MNETALNPLLQEIINSIDLIKVVMYHTNGHTILKRFEVDPTVQAAVQGKAAGLLTSADIEHCIRLCVESDYVKGRLFAYEHVTCAVVCMSKMAPDDVELQNLRVAIGRFPTQEFPLTHQVLTQF